MAKAVKKQKIEKNLKNIQKLFDKATSSHHPNRLTIEQLSKLSVIELCGWIESTHDEIIEQCIKKHPRIAEAEINKHYKKYIKPIYGFHYEGHFRPMLTSILGYKNLINLENKINARGDLDLYKAKLGNYKTIRNDISHTFIEDYNSNIPAPNVVWRDYLEIYSFLRLIEKEVRART